MSVRCTNLHRSTVVLLCLSLGGLQVQAGVAEQTPVEAKGGGVWAAQGPGSSPGGQTEGIPAYPGVVMGENAQVGAVQVIQPHPSNADILYIGAVNGGVWKTTNATAVSPSWTPLTDDQASLSIGAIGLDLNDASGNTIVVGMGRFSNFGGTGGAHSGLIRSTDGGATWTSLANSMVGKRIGAVVVRGQIILAAADTDDANTCEGRGLFRSTNGGASFARISAANGFPSGAADALVGDPSNPTLLYASLAQGTVCSGDAAVHGIYRSADSGANWGKISTPEMDALFLTDGSSSDRILIAVGPNGRVAVAISRDELQGVFHSSNAGATWVNLGVPTTLEEGGTTFGIHPGKQGSVNTSFAIDPSAPNLVYIGGDRQPGGGGNEPNFPNSIGAEDFSGRLFRGDANAAPGSRWQPLTHVGAGNNSSPHADSRAMAFDAAGRLLQGDDGGLYVRSQPASSTGAWANLSGDLQVTEHHSAAYDRIAKVSLAGNQDTANMRQTATSNRLWRVLGSGDGGDVAIDALLGASMSQSVNFTSAQNLSGFARRVYDAGNTLISLDFPALTLTSGGAAPTWQFVTPIAVNQSAGGRLVFGAANGVYESLDAGDTLRLVAEGVTASTDLSDSTLAYGAQGNADVLYVGGCRGDCDSDNDDGVYVRTQAGAPLALGYAARSGSRIVAVALDATNPAHAFAVESANDSAPQRVLRSSDSGATWNSVTGDFPTAAGVIRTIKHLSGTAPGLAVGTDVGVYLSRQAQGFSSWQALGSGLARAPVYELDYDPAQDLLLAGTLGRGSFTLSGVLGGGGGGGGGGDDHGDSCATASAATLNSTLSGTLAPNSDVDFFRFTTSATTMLTAQASTSFDSFGKLFDANCTLIVEDDDSAGNRDFRLQRELSAGTYFLSVSSFNGASGGAYNVALNGSGSGGGGGGAIDEPSLVNAALPVPNPPNASCPSGFFNARVGDGPGSGVQPGIFGLEVLLDAPGTRKLAGGLNFGGLIDVSQRGFAAVNLANSAGENQLLNISLTGSARPGLGSSLPVRLKIERRSGGTSTTVFEQVANLTVSQPFQTTLEVPPGFYVAGVAAEGFPASEALGAPEGRFFFSLTTSFVNRPGGGFQGGAVVGGYHGENPFGTTTGFAAFCLATPHTISAKVLSAPNYGARGARDLRLRVLDANQQVIHSVPE
jgi:hypothetical protein